MTTVDLDREKWMKEHKGPLKDIRGHVWWCGDEYCDCTQAQITERYYNLADPRRRWIIPITIWSGEFHTDGEPGAHAELLHKREALELEDPVLLARIIWDV